MSGFDYVGATFATKPVLRSIITPVYVVSANNFFAFRARADPVDPVTKVRLVPLSKNVFVCNRSPNICSFSFSVFDLINFGIIVKSINYSTYADLLMWPYNRPNGLTTRWTSRLLKKGTLLTNGIFESFSRNAL